jgi:hypothetical protein
VRSAIVVVIALWTAGAATASTFQLPSPTKPLDSRVPLGAATPAGPAQLPRSARAANNQTVLVDVAESGAVTRVRVRQRLTLTGLGDFFFQIPAPVRDVRALPESQSEPGLRRNAVVWQGFSPGRRVLAAELELAPRAAAPALPLRVERLAGGFRLRNTTSVVAPGFAGDVQRPAVLPILSRITELAAGGRPADTLAVVIEGPTTSRRLRIDAPLRILATVEQAGRVLRRVRIVLGGPRPTQTTIQAPAGAELTLAAEPVPLPRDLVRARRNATGVELLLVAERALFRLARVSQYRSFLGSPARGTAHAVYRFRTVRPTAALPTPRRDDGDDLMLVIALCVGGIFALGGAVVVWAHL